MRFHFDMLDDSIPDVESFILASYTELMKGPSRSGRR
jgi:hypothetical protein